MTLQIGQRLERLRNSHQKSVNDLATYLGVTVKTYRRYETEERRPDLEALCKLAVFYETSLDDLLGYLKPTGLAVDRSEIVDIKELESLGVNHKLAHALVKTVWDKQDCDTRLQLFSDNKVKYVYKADMKTLLLHLVEQI